LLTDLGINGDDWLQLAEYFGKKYHLAGIRVGKIH
jgi:hypothetical protein